MSSLETSLRTIADRLRNHAETIATEEAAKTSIVLPFLSALGYDVFNPAEVIPEFTADAVGKRGEKVDYAIKLDGDIRILVECKSLDTKLDKSHLSQLFRYFSVTKAKFAILTNARTYNFHTDLDEPNKLDIRPFFSFDILDPSQSSLVELQKFHRSNFNIDNILATAERLKYVSAIKTHLIQVMESPSDEVIKMVAGKIYDGRLNAQVREMLGGAIKTAFREIIRDSVQSRLSSALESTAPVEVSEQPTEPIDEIETTQEEVEGTFIVKSIVRDIIRPNRINLRDAKAYCAILVDDTNRKPLVRLYFNKKKKYIGLYDNDRDERVEITNLDDIYDFSDRIRETAIQYK